MLSKSQRAKNTFRAFIETELMGKPDRWGNYKFSSIKTGKLYRLKMQSRSWRLERRSLDRWVKSNGAYYTDATGKPSLLRYTQILRLEPIK